MLSKILVIVLIVFYALNALITVAKIGENRTPTKYTREFALANLLTNGLIIWLLTAILGAL